MDGHRFDRLARALATGSSRRQVLKGLLGLGGAAAVGGAILSDSDARTIGSRPSLPPPPTPKPPPTPTATPTPTPPPLCQGYRCGLDCCDEEIQCCDGECCPDGASCLTRLFPEDPSVQEETCCRNDQICDTSTVKCCAADQMCCTRDGVSYCIPADGCCFDEDCPGSCDRCDAVGACRSSCAGDEQCCRTSSGGLCAPDFAICCLTADDCGVDPYCSINSGALSWGYAYCTGICRLSINPCVLADGQACLVNTCDAQNGCGVANQSIDCVVSDWSPWGACSATCGGGTQTRTRTVVTPASCGGAACPALEETRPCNTQGCGPCTAEQLARCSTVTYIDGSQSCSGGGAVGVQPCCDAHADCPSFAPACVTSVTLVLPGNPVQSTICPADPSLGMCAGLVPCPA